MFVFIWQDIKKPMKITSVFGEADMEKLWLHYFSACHQLSVKVGYAV